MSKAAAFTGDFKLKPYWWEDRAPSFYPRDLPLPAATAVVVIGSGVTGVETARVLAEAGRDVLVLDAGTPGEGASSRNAGQIGRNFKHPYSELKATSGPEVAKAFFAELQEAFDAVKAAGEAHPDAFGWRQTGRVIGAMSQPLLDRLTREYALRARDLDENVEELGPDAINEEMGSRLYKGGIRLPWNGSIQPARYYQFLEGRALAAGARIVGHTPVTAVEREATGFVVRTGRGTVRCRNVMVATNGYTGNATPALQKRLLPIVSYMVATEPLSDNQIKATLPRLRTYHDNRRRSNFFSTSPDGRRILMGGRTGTFTLDLKALMATLHGDLAYIFPDLESVRLSHGWSGRCAAPRDLYPRFGEQDGLHYALGYTFSGMAMGPHLARKAAALILGRKDEAHSVFARPVFQPMPLLARSPLTMPVITGWYGWADRPRGLTRRI